MTVPVAKVDAQAAVSAARDELIEISLDIHAHPELAMEEKRASGLLADRLEARGFAVERGAFGLETAFRARWGEGPVTIAYLCEYDALPEIGHACGHNLIATAGLGGALGLKGAISPDAVTLLVLDMLRAPRAQPASPERGPAGPAPGAHGNVAAGPAGD